MTPAHSLGGDPGLGTRTLLTWATHFMVTLNTRSLPSLSSVTSNSTLGKEIINVFF